MKALAGVLIGIVGLCVIATLIGAAIIGALKDRQREKHERRHGLDNNWPRFGF